MKNPEVSIANAIVAISKSMQKGGTKHKALKAIIELQCQCIKFVEWGGMEQWHKLETRTIQFRIAMQCAEFVGVATKMGHSHGILRNINIMISNVELARDISVASVRKGQPL